MEGESIKSWGQWLEWERLGSYSGEGRISSPPTSPLSYQFPKNEKEEEKGKWEEFRYAIEFDAGNIGYGGGRDTVEVMVGWYGWGEGGG